MITRGSKLKIKRLPLSELRVHEYQKRYPDRLTHYLGLLERNSVDDLGLIHVKPLDYGYEVLDGHHRYVALVMSGRVDALCLVIKEPKKKTKKLVNTSRKDSDLEPLVK